MTNRLIQIGAILGALAVAMGAFAAHGLKAVLEPYALDIVKTGAFYQLIHAVVLVALGALLTLQPANRRLTLAGFAFIIGIFLFSGSLYALALGAPSFIGIITPVGGTALIAGWLLLAAAAVSRARS